ncbi:hypothetical protein E4U10_005215 [Claviceps purpurea]|nr:hypothetical protein E4U10_005215 [Claviceps purpurea]
MRIPQNQVPRQQTFSNVLVASPGDPKQHQTQRPRDEDAGRKATGIIDTRTSDNSQTRIEGKLDDLTKGVADIRSKVCDEFMNRCVESEKILVTKSKEAEGLRSELQSLKEQLQQEKSERQDKVEQLETKNTEAKALRSELQFLKKQLQHEKLDRQDKVEQLETKSTEAKGLRSELQSLKKQIQQQKGDVQKKVAGLTPTIRGLGEDKRKLREVNPGNALRHKVSDDEIRQRFVHIRRQIEAVVDNPAYNTRCELKPHVAANDFELRIHQQYNSYGSEDRLFLMRSIIYRILRHYILSRDAFGLAGSVPSHEYNQVAAEALLDHFPGGFEGLLRERKGAVVLYLLFSASSHANKPVVANEVISDWRPATFKCIENFSAALPPRDNSIARDEIRRFLSPMLILLRDSVETYMEISQLCDDAFALWLLTRKSGDRYQFDDPKYGVKCVPGKGTVKVCAVLKNGKGSNCVAFSICGALIKTTGNEESEVTCVLEPAHVVVQAEESESDSDLSM